MKGLQALALTAALVIAHPVDAVQAQSTIAPRECQLKAGIPGDVAPRLRELVPTPRDAQPKLTRNLVRLREEHETLKQAAARAIKRYDIVTVGTKNYLPTGDRFDVHGYNSAMSQINRASAAIAALVRANVECLSRFAVDSPAANAPDGVDRQLEALALPLIQPACDFTTSKKLCSKRPECRWTKRFCLAAKRRRVEECVFGCTEKVGSPGAR